MMQAKKYQRNYLTVALLLAICCQTPLSVWGHSHDHGEEDHTHQSADQYEADHHAHHGGHAVNFIPDKILNPDDSLYEAPAETADYVGTYRATAPVAALGVDLELILSVGEDGLFNLAYYFQNKKASDGICFYTEGDQVHQTPVCFQDLVVFTGALKPGEGGLTTGLIGCTLSPVVLLDEEGQLDRLYPYKALAYNLRENHVNVRVYQSMGLYFTPEEVGVDVNHLIGLDSDDLQLASFERSNLTEDEASLVAQPTYELLQASFDRDLTADHQAFRKEFATANDFLQFVQALFLETNASFPEDTKMTLLEPDQVQIDEAEEIQTAILVNDQMIYAYDGESIYFSETIQEVDGQYQGNHWVKD